MKWLKRIKTRLGSQVGDERASQSGDRQRESPEEIQGKEPKTVSLFQNRAGEVLPTDPPKQALQGPTASRSGSKGHEGLTASSSGSRGRSVASEVSVRTGTSKGRSPSVS